MYQNNTKKASRRMEKGWKKKCVTVITFCTEESMKSGRIGLISRILGATLTSHCMTSDLPLSARTSPAMGYIPLWREDKPALWPLS